MTNQDDAISTAGSNFQFDRDTRVEPLGGDGSNQDGSSGELLYQGRVDASYNIGTNPNGGYLVSLVSDALAQCLAHPDPLTFTTHFLRPGVPDAACEIRVELLRQGRTVSTVRASLIQEGKPRLEVLAAYGDLGQSMGIDSDISLPAPPIAPPDACMPRSGKLQQLEIPMMARLEVVLDMTHQFGRSTLDKDPAGKELKVGGGDPVFSGWIRFPDGRPPDTRSLLMFCDTFPPSPFGKLGIVGWVPTIELTVEVRRRPAPGWIQARFQTDDLADGRMIETGALWDSSGKLVAQSRQLGLVRQMGA